jgi:protease II
MYIGERNDLKGIRRYVDNVIKTFTKENFKGSGLTRELTAFCNRIINRTTKREKSDDKSITVSGLIYSFYSRVASINST